MKLHFAITDGWYWSITQTTPHEVAFIIKGQKCLVKLVDGIINDIEPDLDSFDMNIIKTIMEVNLNYAPTQPPQPNM